MLTHRIRVPAGLDRGWEVVDGVGFAKPPPWYPHCSMEFEWWEAKRLAVLRERGLDFLDARSLFDGRDIYTIPSPRGGEQRLVSIGQLDDVMVGWSGPVAALPFASSR
jgi:hypothetical protein